MSDQPGTTRNPPRKQPQPRSKTIAVWIIAIGIVTSGGFGLIAKIVEFCYAIRSDADERFMLVSLLCYFFVTAGMVCLIISANTRGMFRKIEEPKYTFLDQEESLDRRELKNVRR